MLPMDSRDNAIALPRIGPEFCGGAVRRQLVRAFETDYGFRIAIRDELVRPDARVSLSIVNQTRIAMCLMWVTVDALDVRSAATVAIRIHTELVLAARAADRRPCEKDGSIILISKVKLETRASWMFIGQREGFRFCLGSVFLITRIIRMQDVLKRGL